jgi:hypothetical protein
MAYVRVYRSTEGTARGGADYDPANRTVARSNTGDAAQ